MRGETNIFVRQNSRSRSPGREQTNTEKAAALKKTYIASESPSRSNLQRNGDRGRDRDRGRGRTSTRSGDLSPELLQVNSRANQLLQVNSRANPQDQTRQNEKREHVARGIHTDVSKGQQLRLPEMKPTTGEKGKRKLETSLDPFSLQDGQIPGRELTKTEEEEKRRKKDRKKDRDKDRTSNPPPPLSGMRPKIKRRGRITSTRQPTLISPAARPQILYPLLESAAAEGAPSKSGNSGRSSIPNWDERLRHYLDRVGDRFDQRDEQERLNNLEATHKKKTTDKEDKEDKEEHNKTIRNKRWLNFSAQDTSAFLEKVVEFFCDLTDAQIEGKYYDNFLQLKDLLRQSDNRLKSINVEEVKLT